MRVRKVLVVVGLGVLVVVGISWVGATSFGRNCYDPSLMASWVQAVGSIAAIGAGVLFIQYQSELARIKRRKALVAMLEVAIDTLAKKGGIPDDNLEAGMQMVNINPHRLTYIRGALAAIPLHDLESAEHVRLVEDAIEILRTAERYIESLGGPIAGEQVTAGIGKAYREQYARMFEIKAFIDRHG
ncbi:hypothetical protein RA280_24540 [Cupriavidus sp. CV2]|uniref:hypothetical protein n=1 Tax=Cupriavidus ulmosensis TaxID=3065913 RepID=UPI00296B46D5|nr:hypothetical protein [Cupriavidus sp. CV2]MDW3684862.1 hypothetical protein [Cupriavidus sp. CV2]